MRFWAATALVAMALAAPATAAPAVRTPEQRQILLDLAHVLGQAHALHRVCAGAADDTWRGRMARMLEVEAPSDAFKAKLTESFNAGFTAKDAQAKDCKSAGAAEAAVAKKGAALAQRLGGAAP
jgi:uncharacterized protein (TIGR02301 family)